jgi:hypothetical protein
MNLRKYTMLVMLSLLLVLSVTATIAYADEFDQAMKLTFGQPIAIPGQVLPAGTYWFMLPNHGEIADNVIQVFDSERKSVIATLNVANNEVAKPSGDVIITLADRSPKPQALLNLTYPGRDIGHTFEVSYSKQEQSAMAEYPKIRLKVGENGVMQTWNGDEESGKNITSGAQGR